MSKTETAMPENHDNTGNHQTAGWSICFQPHVGLLGTCNDPIRMLRELGALGELTVESDLSTLPEFSDLTPEELFIGWRLTLNGAVEKTAILEVFAWVETDCDLQLTPLTAASESLSDSIDTETEFDPDTTPKPASPSASKLSSEAFSIRVSTDKVDALVNMVGELVITQSMLNIFRNSHEFDMAAINSLHHGLAELMRNTRSLQESVMAIRMLPVSLAFNRFPRIIQDLGRQLGKKVQLKISGEDTEVDKTVLEKVGDPLLHLVRNALDHGIETPAERLAAGKPETGTLELNAFHDGGNIVIQVIDDGAGINKERVLVKARERGLIGEHEHLTDKQINNLVFSAGFSGASNASGHEAGMDAVRHNIQELGGTMQIESEEGVGCRLSIRMPLTLAILEGQLLRVGRQTYIIPLASIVETTQVTAGSVRSITGESEVFKLRDQYIPVLRLHDVFGIEPDSRNLTDGLLVIVGSESRRTGVFVDELGDQQQIVTKSLAENFRQVDGLSGATILADGTVGLIIDVSGLLKILSESNKQGHFAASAAA